MCDVSEGYLEVSTHFWELGFHIYIPIACAVVLSLTLKLLAFTHHTTYLQNIRTSEVCLHTICFLNHAQNTFLFQMIVFNCLCSSVTCYRPSWAPPTSGHRWMMLTKAVYCRVHTRMFG